MTNQPLDNYRSPEAARLDALERRWTEVNQRQSRSITRLLVNRQRVLDLIHSDQRGLTTSTRDAIAAALNADVDPALIAAVAEVVRRDERRNGG